MSREPVNWYPEIMYEEESKIPFVQVPDGEVMPGILFIFESRQTDEFEPGPDGEELPIVDLDLYQYANMNQLKENLTPEIYDEVRGALGLEPLEAAAAKGRNITTNVRNSVENA